MDIEYLLFLQGLRESAPAWVSLFFTFMSEFTVSIACLMIPAVVYWCVSKSAGSYLLFNLGASNVVNGCIKNTVCAYRPWIRDARIETSLKATATGYSFPSGHTTTAVSLYGGLGVCLRRYGKWVVAVSFIPVVLTGFARNWVGAHTPQDVVCGLLFSAAVLVLSLKLFTWLAEHPERDVQAAAVCFAAGVAVLVYVSVKPYPLDLAADGSLLVDPQKMMLDCFKDTGRFFGFLAAWPAERRLVRFDAGGTLPRRVLRAVCGGAGLWLLNTYTKAPLQAVLGARIGVCLYGFLLTFYIVLVYPLLVALVQKHSAPKTAAPDTAG